MTNISETLLLETSPAVFLVQSAGKESSPAERTDFIAVLIHGSVEKKRGEMLQTSM